MPKGFQVCFYKPGAKNPEYAAHKKKLKKKAKLDAAKEKAKELKKKKKKIEKEMLSYTSQGNAVPKAMINESSEEEESCPRISEEDDAVSLICHSPSGSVDGDVESDGDSKLLSLKFHIVTRIN